MTDRDQVDIEALIDDVRDNVEAPELAYDLRRALRELRTLRALRERVERAPVYVCKWPDAIVLPVSFNGKRVALVALEDEPRTALGVG